LMQPAILATEELAGRQSRKGPACLGGINCKVEQRRHFLLTPGDNGPAIGQAEVFGLFQDGWSGKTAEGALCWCVLIIRR
jgi:hypothetical protein